MPKWWQSPNSHVKIFRSPNWWKCGHTLTRRRRPSRFPRSFSVNSMCSLLRTDIKGKDEEEEEDGMATISTRLINRQHECGSFTSRGDDTNCVSPWSYVTFSSVVRCLPLPRLDFRLRVLGGPAWPALLPPRRTPERTGSLPSSTWADGHSRWRAPHSV